MKNRTKYLAALVLVLVFGGMVVAQQSGYLQGRIVGGGTVSLSTSSPSGAKTVSTNDEIMALDLKASSTAQASIYAGTALLFTINTDANDLSIASVGSRVSILDQFGAEAGYGYIELDSYSQAWVTIYLKKDLQASAGTTSTFPIMADTDTILADDAGVDDPVTVTVQIDKGTAAGNQKISGNTMTY